MECISEISENTINVLYDILTSNISKEEKARQIVEKTNYQEVSKFFYWNGKTILSRKKPILEEIRSKFLSLKSEGYFQKYELTYRCDFDEVNRRLRILNELNGILKQDITDEEKIKFVLKYFPTYNDFRMKYSLMIKYGTNDDRLCLGRKSLDEFERINGEVLSLFNNEQLMENIKYEQDIVDLLENNNYLVNYKYAEWVINAYLDYNRAYLKSEFIKNIGITLDRFNECLKIVSLLNPVLYTEYKQQLTDNSNKRKKVLFETFASIADAINTGYFYDGTPLSLGEFYKRLPMKNKGIDYIRNFLRNNPDPKGEVYFIIDNYLNENNIKKIHFVSEEQILNEKCVRTISGLLITPEIIHKVFDHMRANNYPPVEQLYNTLLIRYARGQIELDPYDDSEDKAKTLIKIPYQFVS